MNLLDLLRGVMDRIRRYIKKRPKKRTEPGDTSGNSNNPNRNKKQSEPDRGNSNETPPATEQTADDSNLPAPPQNEEAAGNTDRTPEKDEQPTSDHDDPDETPPATEQTADDSNPPAPPQNEEAADNTDRTLEKDEQPTSDHDDPDETPPAAEQPEDDSNPPAPPQNEEAAGNTDRTPEKDEQPTSDHDDPDETPPAAEQLAVGEATTTHSEPPSEPNEDEDGADLNSPEDTANNNLPDAPESPPPPSQNEGDTDSTSETPENDGQPTSDGDDSGGAASATKQATGRDVPAPPPLGPHPDPKEDAAPADNADETDDSPGNKRKRRSGTDSPKQHGGRRGKHPKKPVSPRKNGSASFTPRPELVCRNRPEEWRREIVLSVPEECNVGEVRHNGTVLSADNGEYLLPSFYGKVTVDRTDGEPYEFPLFSGDARAPLIFKFSNNWKGRGRSIGGVTRGHFILVAPREWTRTGDVPVEPEECVDSRFLAHRFLAHFFSTDQNTDEFGGFAECNVGLTRAGFELCGERLFDDSEQGELFVGAPPVLKPRPGIVWARVGEEGQSGGWSGENFKPANKSLENVLNGRQGRFYVRVYDGKRSLADSGEFRYCKDLREIRVNGEPYSRDMLLAPSAGGHSSVRLQFVGANGVGIRPDPQQPDNPHAVVGSDGVVTIAPHPEGNEKTTWSLNSSTGGADVVIGLPRIWWRLEHSETQPRAWRDTPLVMTREEFCDHAGAGVVGRLRLPSHIRSFRIGFGEYLGRNLRVADGLPFKDFVDDEEIDSPLSEDALLRVQFDEKTTLPLIRITADPAPPPDPPPPGSQLYAQVKRKRTGDLRTGKGFSRGELQGADMTAAEAKRLHIRIDRRRKSVRQINIGKLNTIKDNA